MIPPLAKGTVVAISSQTFDMVEQLKAQDVAVRKFAQAAYEFLDAVVPHDRAFPFLPLAFLRDAFIEWMCCGTDRQIEAAKANTEEHRRIMASYSRPVPAEELIRITERRNFLLEQIEQCEQAKRNFPMEGMADMIEAAIVSPIRREMQMVESQLSDLQREMEADSANAQSPQPDNEAEGSANTKEGEVR